MTAVGQPSGAVDPAVGGDSSIDGFQRMLSAGGTQSSRAHRLSGGCTVTVYVSHAEGDASTVRRITEALEPLVASCDTNALARVVGGLPQWKLVGVSQSDGLLIDAGRVAGRFVATRPLEEGAGGRAVRRAASRLASSDAVVVLVPRVDPEARAKPLPEDPPQNDIAHTRLAREVREMTGLPAATLAAALGVTREQYQRWLRGDPISVIRHGLLVHLHTVVADATRRLGPDARLWWRTPVADGVSPEQLLTDRLVDRVHRLISELPDANPIVAERVVALPVQQLRDFDENDDLDENDDVDANDENSDVSWSPYGEDGRPKA